jgi:hypothetical protein
MAGYHDTGESLTTRIVVDPREGRVGVPTAGRRGDRDGSS